MAKIKAHIFVLLAVLILLGVIVSPVSGYSKEYSGGYANPPSAEWGMPGWLFINQSGNFFSNVSQLTWNGYGYIDGAASNKSGSWNITLEQSGCFSIPAVCSWSLTGTGYNSPMSITLDWGEPFEVNEGCDGFFEVECIAPGTQHNKCTGVIQQSYATPNYTSGAQGYTLNSDDDIIGWFVSTGYHYPVQGTYELTGDPVNNVPVADFACDNVFSNPSADITCTDLSTNTPTSWEFHSYYPNYTNYTEHTVDYTDSPWTLNLPDLGYYDVHLKVSNSAGSDWENKSEYIRIMLFPSWTATPTPSITAVPWTNLTTFNMTAYRYNITSSTIGNITSPFLDVIDGLYSIIEPAFIAFERVLSWPFLMINAQFEQINNIYSETWATLISYTVVPLSITGRVVSAIPWEIQAIITMGIIFDIILLLIRGE